MHCNAGGSTTRVRWAGNDKWQAHSTRWKDPGSFQNLNDTCLNEFDWWWVRGSQPPSGSKNWQREATSQNISWLILSAYIYIWIPHPRDLEAGILYFAENCCWFEIEISTLGDLCFVGGEEGIPLLGGRCWIGTHLVVSPLGLSYHINKIIWVSPTCLYISDALLYLHV